MLIKSKEEAPDLRELFKYSYDHQAKELEWTAHIYSYP